MRTGSDMRALFRQLKAAGLDWEPCSDGYKVYEGKRLVGTLHRKLGDPRARLNFLADIRKQGVKI